jgi:adenylate kinase
VKSVNQNNKIEELKEKNRQILEKRSQVLRLYLIENVIPILSEGILKISHELPDNPVETLQKFLEDKAKMMMKKNDD